MSQLLYNIVRRGDKYDNSFFIMVITRNVLLTLTYNDKVWFFITCKINWKETSVFHLPNGNLCQGKIKERKEKSQNTAHFYVASTRNIFYLYNFRENVLTLNLY
jgi:hypothetical protein